MSTHFKNTRKISLEVRYIALHASVEICHSYEHKESNCSDLSTSVMQLVIEKPFQQQHNRYVNILQLLCRLVQLWSLIGVAHTGMQMWYDLLCLWYWLWQIFSKQEAFKATFVPVLMCYAHNIPWLHVCCIVRSKSFRSKSLRISSAFYLKN